MENTASLFIVYMNTGNPLPLLKTENTHTSWLVGKIVTFRNRKPIWNGGCISIAPIVRLGRNPNLLRYSDNLKTSDFTGEIPRIDSKC